MRFSIPSIFLLALCAAPAISKTAAPTISLPYARYQGFHNSTSGLDVFLGIRYARAPVGDLRWRAPKAPLPVKETLQATSQPAKCSQSSVLANFTLGPPDPTTVEDCLFLNVYAPPSSAKKRKLPVLVWIHGGGYLFGDAASYDPTPMIQASKHSFVAVIIQYRLGVFGFLPGSEVKKNGALNAGLLDTEFALKWTQENIHLFGGDPDQVTIWGESAGGGAVLEQAVAHGGKTSPALFKRAIASSPYLPPHYRYDDPESELQYTTFVNNTGCTNAVDTLECLRALDYITLAAGYTDAPRPVIDGYLLTQRPQSSLAKKQINGERLISLHNTDEGRILVTRDANSTVRSWVAGQFPRLSEQNITVVEKEYHSFASSDASEADNIYEIQIMIFGEVLLVCPGLWLAEGFSKASYEAEFAVPPAIHGLDIAVYFPSTGFADIFKPAQPFSQSLTQSFMGALVSFILTGSPNNNPMSQSVNPDWTMYRPMDPKGMVFNVTESGAANPELKKVDSALRQRCSLWAALAPFTQQ
ncbi:unnamed protein product [Rhizoctonia solani]|uniref:Carboxylic ester hydrolase n=1 Tax=Rhizoctonia solani TaxID=456999 RepID=A0A8H3HG78_9AGAM|nr:unnamed protein product [Rhizoctonia solani]